MCYKGGEPKEQNALIPCMNEMGSRTRPKMFTMIIKEGRVFYACHVVGNEERLRYRVHDPFPRGVEKDILDLREHVPLSQLNDSLAFSLSPRSDYRPCDDPECFCGTRGMRTALHHICPICYDGVMRIKNHIRGFHKLLKYPTLAELPPPRDFPYPTESPLTLISEIDHLSPSSEIAALLPGVLIQPLVGDTGTAAGQGRPPSAEKTTQGGAVEPPPPPRDDEG